MPDNFFQGNALHHAIPTLRARKIDDESHALNEKNPMWKRLARMHSRAQGGCDDDCATAVTRRVLQAVCL
jgi:hypothetical protein